MSEISEWRGSLGPLGLVIHFFLGANNISGAINHAMTWGLEK